MKATIFVRLCNSVKIFCNISQFFAAVQPQDLSPKSKLTPKENKETQDYEDSKHHNFQIMSIFLCSKSFNFEKGRLRAPGLTHQLVNSRNFFLMSLYRAYIFLNPHIKGKVDEIHASSYHPSIVVRVEIYRTSVSRD